jgi:putative transposase
MASSPKRAKDQRAHLVLIDESGMMMAPLVRRSLAPAGQTPILKQKASHRDRVSLVAALSISPVCQRLGLRFRTFQREYINNERAADFLRSLLHDLRGRVMVVWDRGNMHRGNPIRELLARFPRLELHWLPPYAPELNPVEHLWNHLKYGRFPNYAPPDTQVLNLRVRRRLQVICGKPDKLQSFLNASNLTFDSLTERQ